MTQHRFFAAQPEVYEMIRTTLDAAWSLPNQKGTMTCLRPASDVGSPRDSEGRVVVAVLPEWCEWEPASTMLPQLISTNMAEEISASEYQQALGAG